MGKPALFHTENSVWGVPCRVRNFLTDSQLHSAMESHAKSLSPDVTECVVKVTFDDDSSFEEVVARSEKTMTYRDYDGEVWEAVYFGKRWQIDDVVSIAPMVAVAKAYNLDRSEVKLELVG